MTNLFSFCGGLLVGIVISRLAFRAGASLTEAILLAIGMCSGITLLALGMPS